MSYAILFPGQGSQSIGMVADMAQNFPAVAETFQQASDVLQYDLWQIVTSGPAEKLNQTTITQPAMLTAGVAFWRVWQQQCNLQPAYMAGHSLGEYTALVAADALSFSDAVALVADRGRFMQEAVAEGVGAMAAILGLDLDPVTEICNQINRDDHIVAAVNINSPQQIVIAGHTAAVEEAMAQAKAQGAKRAVLLPVSVPSHCALMQPAAQRLQQRLNEIIIREAGIAVLNNADVAVASSVTAIGDALVRQLYSPVRWVETIQAMHRNGVSTVVEVGPGKVLAGLNKRIEKSMAAYAVTDAASLQETISALQQS